MIGYALRLLAWLFRAANERAGRGWVADFCPLCRDVRPLAVIAHQDTGRGLEVNLSPTALAHTAVCAGCRVERAIVLTDYCATAASNPARIEDLVAATQPDVGERRGSRLALEEQLSAGRAPDGGKRQWLLQEPLRAIGFVVRGGARVSNARLHEVVGRALAPLAPSHEELDRALEATGTAKRLDAGRLLAVAARPPVPEEDPARTGGLAVAFGSSDLVAGLWRDRYVWLLLLLLLAFGPFALAWLLEALAQ